MMMWLTQAIGRQDNAFLEVGTVLSTSPLRVDAGGLIEDVWLCAPANTHTLPQQGGLCFDHPGGRRVYLLGRPAAGQFDDRRRYTKWI